MMKTFKQYVSEAWLNDIGKSQRREIAGYYILGQRLNDLHRDYSVETLGPIDKEHNSIRIKNSNWKSRNTFAVHHTKSDKITHVVHGTMNKGNVLSDLEAGSTGKSPVKMHDLYHHILKHGHVNALVGTDHSVGSQKTWQKLASKPGITIHGWTRGKPVNIDPKNPDETHSHSRADDDGGVGSMALVASYKAKKR